MVREDDCFVIGHFFLIGSDDDMIEVPIVVPSREPILPPEFPLDETPSQANTSAETVESIEEEKDESSNNSSAVEDIQPYLNEPEIQSLERMQTEIITDTAEQMAKARGHERMTTTLNDTMHEDTQVRTLFQSSL